VDANLIGRCRDLPDLNPISVIFTSALTLSLERSVTPLPSRRRLRLNKGTCAGLHVSSFSSHPTTAAFRRCVPHGALPREQQTRRGRKTGAAFVAVKNGKKD